MQLDELIRELANRLGLGEVALEDDGGAQIVVDDELSIDIERDEERTGFIMSATVGAAPSEDVEVVLKELMEANLMGQGTNGAALALDRVLGEIVLCRTIAQPELPYEAFEQELSRFTQALRFWRQRLSDGEMVPAAEEEAADPDLGAERVGMLRV